LRISSREFLYVSFASSASYSWQEEEKRQVLLGQETSASLLTLGKGNDEVYVFRNKAYHTKKLTTRSVQYIVKEAAKRAGAHDWKHVSPHWMRHSHALMRSIEMHH
jgi:site-specific recombinase XerD